MIEDTALNMLGAIAAMFAIGHVEGASDRTKYLFFLAIALLCFIL